MERLLVLVLVLVFGLVVLLVILVLVLATATSALDGATNRGDVTPALRGGRAMVQKCRPFHYALHLRADRQRPSLEHDHPGEHGQYHHGPHK